MVLTGLPTFRGVGHPCSKHFSSEILGLFPLRMSLESHALASLQFHHGFHWGRVSCSFSSSSVFVRDLFLLKATRTCCLCHPSMAIMTVYLQAFLDCFAVSDNDSDLSPLYLNTLAAIKYSIV
jgi:hypothetical protein